MSEQSEKKIALINGRNCDKYDYLLAVACGSIAGVVDIFLVGKPGSNLGNWSDKQVDNLVEVFARRLGWKGNGVASAIGFLERKFPVNYDQRNTADVDGAFKMASNNHHLKQLGHSPDPIGLFFSILDQFQGKATFISDGKLIRIDTETSELRGETFHAKLFCGFCNWLGHIMSDVAGSSGGRGKESGRGSGIGIPFYELFQFCGFGQVQIKKDRQTFAMLMTRVFQEGYDARFGIAMAIPVVLTELLIRVVWAVKQHFYHKRPWEECIPNSRHSDLRCMLIVGNATLCIFDVTEASIKSKGDPIQFVLHLNIIAWYKLVLMIFKEIMIRFDFTYADLKLQLQRVNEALDECLVRLKSIDYVMYEAELQEIRGINNILSDDHAGTEQIYQYFSSRNIEMQFHSFKEFDQKMQDKDFVLEI